MNFLHNLRRFIFIFLAPICWTNSAVYSSAADFQELGRPYIQICLPATNTRLNHFNSIIQDNDGFIYIGARNGILRFDGISWNLTPVNGNVRLIKEQGQILGYTKYGKGILSRSLNGDLEFLDLEAGGGNSGTDPKKETNSGGDSRTNPQKETNPGGDSGANPQKETNSGFWKGPDSPVASQIIIPGMPGEFEITSFAELSLGNIAYGTRKQGIFILSPEGIVLRRIRMAEGLYSNEIIQLMVDVTNNLWALHEHAASRIEISSAFSIFDYQNGLYGNVKDILRHENTLYAASSQGLFSLSTDKPVNSTIPENAMFKKVPNIEGSCRTLASTKKSLIAGSSAGLYELTKEIASKILDEPVNKVLYAPVLDLLFVGTDNGFHVYNTVVWREYENFSLPRLSIDDIAISSAGFLWLSSRSGALYRTIKPLGSAVNMSYSSYTPADLGIGSDLAQASQSLFIDLIEISGELYFSSPEGLFKFNPEEELFQPETSLSLSIPWINYDLESLQYRKLNKRIVNYLFQEGENILWIATNEGIVRFDSKASGTSISADGSRISADGTIIPAASAHISGIQIGDNAHWSYDFLASETFQKSLSKNLLPIRYRKNKIRFELLTTDFNSESSPLFQYRLAGLNNEWSDWSAVPFVEFHRLNPGKYQFFVRSQDIFGIISDPDTFGFRIKLPVYATWYAFILYVVLAMFLLFLIRRWKNLQEIRSQFHLEEVVLERTEALIKEKEKSEDLLANMLPKTTSDELKASGKATSSKFKMVTVLFADIQGFTKIAEEMDADKLIDQLDRFYFQFDTVVEKYNIEKIKTIGDAYMAAGGIPVKNRTNPVEVVLAALEMQHYMKKLKDDKTDIWDLRIGIHTGSVIAGVVGQKKYSYDIWGDSVNTASRMESSGEIGRVNISATTYKLIKDFFQCEFRGKMPVKYKGDIAMFFVNGLNPSYSEADRITPNKKFLIQIQLLRLLDLEEYCLEKLQKELPEDLYFHKVDHTSHVYSQVELLGRGEKVSEEDLLILRSAALLHDIGYIDRMDDHEVRSVEYAREILPLYRYQDEQIERICQLIMSTSFPPNPQNLLEEILCDANLDHLGRVDFLIQSDKLFQEYRMRQKIKSKQDWNQFQINFLENHKFYTPIANKMREVSKEQQIENIRQFS